LPFRAALPSFEWKKNVKKKTADRCNLREVGKKKDKRGEISRGLKSDVIQRWTVPTEKTYSTESDDSSDGLFGA